MLSGILSIGPRARVVPCRSSVTVQKHQAAWETSLPVRVGRSGGVQGSIAKLAGRVEVFVEVVLCHASRR